MLNQAREFHETVGLTGLVLTKLDGTARGGAVVSVVDALRLPVKFIGAPPRPPCPCARARAACAAHPREQQRGATPGRHCLPHPPSVCAFGEGPWGIEQQVPSRSLSPGCTGVGETVEDLQPFSAEAFVNALFPEF